MTKKTSYWRFILWFGFLLIGWGLLGTVLDSLFRSRIPYRSDFGIFLGFGAHMVIGVFAVVIAGGLRNLEERLDRIEAAKRD